jgi:hypothetical protein
MPGNKVLEISRSLSQNLKVDPGIHGPWQWGTIKAIHSGVSFSTLDVYLDNSSTGAGGAASVATGLPFINGYNPTVGDVVLIARMGGNARTQRVVLGPLEVESHGLTKGGNYLGDSYQNEGITGLNNAVTGRWIGNWSSFGPPQGTFVSQVGDWGYDGNFAQWECIASGVWRTYPMGVLPGGFKQVTTNQGPFTAATDLTGLTVTVTPGTGRLIRITGRVLMSSSVAGDIPRLQIQEGATVLQIDQAGTPTVATETVTILSEVILAPTAGSHTYKLTGVREVGTGNITMQAGLTYPAFILAEDIGSDQLQLVLQGKSSLILFGSGTHS